MHTFPKGHALANTKPYERIRESTILKEWMKLRKRSCSEVAKATGVSTRIVKYWMNGQALPNLIHAFKLEEMSKGQVTLESWMSTTIGKAKYNCITMEGKKRG